MLYDNKYNMNIQGELPVQNFGGNSSPGSNTQKSEQIYTSNFDKWCQNPQTWKPLTRLFLCQEKKESGQIWGFRLIFRLLLLFFTITVFKYGSDFWRGATIIKRLHIISLACHEVGHVIFGLFDFTSNNILKYLGGYLNQILVPLICCIVLLVKKRDVFWSSVCLWRVFESMIDGVSYIADANVMALPLITGGIGLDHPYGGHDRNYIFTEWGILDQASKIASSLEKIALFGLCISLIRGARCLYYSKKYSLNFSDGRKTNSQMLSEQQIKEIEDQIKGLDMNGKIF